MESQLRTKWNLIFSKNSGTAWISFRPHLGLNVYPCYSCRDLLVSKTTFQDHINRRAIVLKYDCKECMEILTFYNRCAFLLHARSHFSLEEGKIDLNNIEICDLPFGMMGFLPHPDVTRLFDVEEDIIEENCYINAQFYKPDRSEKGKRIITLRPNDLLFCSMGQNSQMFQLTLKQISNNIPMCQFVTTDFQRELKQSFLSLKNTSKVKEELPERCENFHPNACPVVNNSVQLPIISKIESLSTHDQSEYQKCPECKQNQRCSIKMHFIGKNMPLDEKLKCSLCKYVSSTNCSYLAHVRIHYNNSPFICPECGRKFESRECLMRHLDEVCFHLAKQVRIRCPGKKCGKLFASPTTFSIHFSQHIQTWLQCTVCKECFESVSGFSEHTKIHSNLCFSDKVFKCLGCKNNDSIIYHDNLKEHLEFHTGDRSRYMYVFVCKFCRNYFRSSGTYSAHLLKCQKMQDMIKQGYTYSVDFCTQCYNRIIFYDNENFVACTKCRSINSMSQKTNCDDITPNHSLNVEICHVCKQVRDEHLFDCPYRKCGIIINKIDSEILSSSSFNSETSIDASFEYENDDTLKEPSPENDLKIAPIKHIETDYNFKSARMIVSPKREESSRKKRKGEPLVFHTKKIILSSTSGNNSQAGYMKAFDGTYYCKICDFQEHDHNKFHFHVLSHRHISTDYQCMDCGECFVVKPSLAKHLKHFHKITDIDSYFENNDCYDKSAVKELKEFMEYSPGECTEHINDNQCKICLQQFSDDNELQEHFYIHGSDSFMKDL